MQQRARAVLSLLAALLTAASVSPLDTARARGPKSPPKYANVIPHRPSASPVSLDRRLPRPLHSTAVPETTVLGYWTFDDAWTCVDQGWTSHDVSYDVQPLVAFHVDDFAGLGGGDFGLLLPVEGNQSMWCGARADSTHLELCGYAVLPGYGNGWVQYFGTVNCLGVFGDVTLDFLATYDSEPAYDGTYIQYDVCDGGWYSLDLPPPFYNYIDGTGQGELFSTTVPESLHAGSLRLRLMFASDGAFSDEDGLWPTDGGVIVDSLTVSDASGIVLSTELFEAEAVGATTTVSGNWQASVPATYGDFAGLYHGAEVVQEDPCWSNLSCLWAFFNGSTADYACGGWPTQKVVPYHKPRETWGERYIANEIWSPWVPIVGNGSTFELGFDVYRDLPVDPLVFYVWHVRSLVGGCPDRGWQDRNLVLWGEEKAWVTEVRAFGDLVEAGATDLQMALGVVDMCSWWCGFYGTGTCHTHAPLFDNAWMVRIDTNGPVWSVRDIDLFQDSFPGDGTTTGTVRADAAFDVLPTYNPNYRPGDSVLVNVGDPEYGLGGDIYTGFGPAVYAYVGVWPQGQAGKSGDALTGDSFRWPVVDSLSHAGNKWYLIRMDTAFAGGPSRTEAQPGRYCLDLNDSLFTPGDTVCYLFCASNDSPSFETTYYTRFTGTTDDLAYALNNPMEFTCLPVSSPTGGRRILYVDNFDGLGAQPFFDTAFQILGLQNDVDRYDVLQAASVQENGLASRVTDPLEQLVGRYHTIIWNSGDLVGGTLKDGDAGQKLDDVAVLKAFLDNLPVPGGLYLSGDDLADELNGLSNPGAVQLRSEYIGFSTVDGDHTNFGLPMSPYVIGVDGGCFDHPFGPDTLVAYGGCPYVSRFDVLQATGAANTEAIYVSGGTTAAAVVAQMTTNALAADVGVVLSGFSFHQIRDSRATSLTTHVAARAEHLKDIITWLGNLGPLPIGTGRQPHFNSLAQNYPNPFNPSTTVEFTVRERAPVRLDVYNVAGQLVATLVDDERAPGVVHRVVWDGTNNAGQGVASGVYFYRLQTISYTKTRKMVLLK